MFDLHIYCALRRNSANKGFELLIPMARQDFNRRERRFNFCTSPGFEPEPRGVTGYLLLVSHPSPRLRLTDHPGPTTHENCIFAGPGIAAPLRRGELRPRQDGGGNHIRRKGELGMLLVRAAPRRTIQSWNRHRLNMLCRPL